MFNNTTIKILFLFLPGIITVAILQFFNEKNKKYSLNETFFFSFIFSIVSYIIYSFFNKEVLVKLINYDNLNFPLTTRDIFYLCSIGTILGLVFTFLRTRGTIQNQANNFKISYETGFKTVLETIYKSNFPNMKTLREKYVQIKLFDGTADYCGFIKHYEIHDNYTEFLLFGTDTLSDNPQEQVEITFKNNSNPNKDYTQPAVYLKLPNGSFSIEYL
jgi:hypothetical protein|nr:MAG TPA_asm: Protein of unknown function (DUF1616) [Caudoviricetes sp.]